MSVDKEKIDSVEQALIAASRSDYEEKCEFNSISAAVMTTLRREKQAELSEQDYSWDFLIRPLATCLALALVAIVCTTFYFSSNAYDDTIINVLADNSEYAVYDILGEY